MAISMKPSKPRKLKTRVGAKLRRQAYAADSKIALIRVKRAKAAKAYYKKNKAALAKKAKITRAARKR